jgi:hypothetical protein
MKNLFAISLTVFFTIFSFSAFATTYYLSSSSGNDSNSGTDPSSPWRTIDKLNSFYSLQPGDNVLFKRGDTFYGGIVVNNSGSSGNPITYGAYGSGAKPVITGFTNITSWNSLGGNIWESTDAVSSLPYTNMVSVNGVNTAMGRYPNSTGPNTGYLYIQSHSGNTSITAVDGLGSNNWTGAGIVIRKAKYVIERGNITSQYGNTLNYTGAGVNDTQDGFGFFIQNDPKTLDVNGEWYYNPSTRKLRVYYNSSPSDVRIATIQNLVSSYGKSNFSVENLSFTGSNGDAISCLNSGANLTVQNCDISLAGMSAVWTVMTNSVIQNNNINDINYIGVYSSNDNAVIKSNNFNNINIWEGEDQIIASGGVISTYGQNTLIQYNQINNCGYSGIKLGGLNTQVRNNFVNRFCLIKEDGGGIDMSARDRAKGSIIDGNIVINGIGSSNGTSDVNSHDFGVIFIDAYGTGITITNNSVANVATAGIKLHGANNITIKGNTTFNNGGPSWTKGGLLLLSVDEYPIYNLTVENNIFVAQNPNQYAFFGYPGMQSFGTSDNNYFAKPIDESTAMKAYTTVYSLLNWKSYSNEDWNSKGSPKTISDVNDLRFEYNASSSSKTIQLDANYIDVKSNSYNGSITLAPYSSAVLIRNGAKTNNQPPIADVGDDRTIELPKNSITLPGSGTDGDGSITSYSWSQLSGPSTAELTNSSSAQAGANNLVEGVYQFQLEVKDNQGASGTAVLKVTVLSEQSTSNVPPVTSVGDDRVIVLPKNSVVLPGSASDQDGFIQSYQWSQVSGPSSATLINSSSAQAGAGDLVAGTYQFQLKATDNQGGSSTAILKVTVNTIEAASVTNIAPVANVGSDRSIDLPKNSIVLPGSGSDQDGSISSYNWSQISGPNNAMLINPTSAQGGASNLVEGNYQFQLKVTDDQGATGTAILDVKVNSVPNIPPVANVGSDRSIDLPKNSIVLPGSGSDEDGSVTSYNWSQISGPNKAMLINPTSALAGASNLVEGNYQFQLEVTDNLGATGTTILYVKVNPVNIPPVADAGSDRNIDLPKNSIVLAGRGSDEDGSVTSYSWSQISGPNSALLINPSLATGGASNLIAGNYQFQLVVTDNRGATDKDVINVTVSGSLSAQRQMTTGTDNTSVNTNDTKLNITSGSSILNATENLTLGISAYPNPFVNTITVRISGPAGPFSLTLIDASGRTLWVKKGTKNDGLYEQSINTSNIQKGIYLLTLIQNNERSTVKLEK